METEDKAAAGTPGRRTRRGTFPPWPREARLEAQAAGPFLVDLLNDLHRELYLLNQQRGAFEVFASWAVCQINVAQSLRGYDGDRILVASWAYTQIEKAIASIDSRCQQLQNEVDFLVDTPPDGDTSESDIRDGQVRC